MQNILLIDDEDAIVLALSMALSQAGYNVEIATDGLEGVKKFDEGNFGLVITDVRMPGLDGNVLTQHIRNSEKHCTPVIGISGTPWLLEDDAFDAVLSKPFSIKTLFDTIDHLTTTPVPAAI